MTACELFDVQAVNMKTGVARLIDASKDKANADAIVHMCVMRLGCDKEYFVTVPAGTSLATGFSAAAIAKEQSHD